MDRESPYLPIDTKINFMGVRFGKSREGVVTTPLVRRVTKNSLVRLGLRIKMLIHKDTQSMKYSKDKSRVWQLHAGE